MNSLPASALSALLRLAEKEAKRRLLSSDLLAFTHEEFAQCGERFIESWHHRKIAEALDSVRRGEIRNLVINLPPRYGKTEMAVIGFIAQSIAANHKARFIHLSYSDDLALDNSAKVREIIKSSWFQDYWPVALKDDADSKKKWYTSDGGGLYATAAGGPITGFGAGITDDSDDSLFSGAIIIDDPHKVDDIDRETERQRVNDRLNTTIKSRRNSRRTPIIIIMQRLHEDDMSGFALAGRMGEDFHHLMLPVVIDGKPLWEYKHTLAEIAQMKTADHRTFSAQYMQDPSPDDGIFFKRDMFRRYRVGDEPRDVVTYGAADYAVTEGGGDFTELGIAGFDSNDDLYLLDWWTGQETADVWIDAQLNMVRNRKPLIWAAESGAIRRSIEPFLKKEMQRQRTYCALEWLPAIRGTADAKAANARAFQALCAQGKVWIPLTPWGDDLITQLLQFPGGKHDDKVDVCGLFGRILHEAFGPRMVTEETKTQKDGYGLGDDDAGGEDWQTA